MDQFGVMTPALKALAEVPRPPKLDVRPDSRETIYHILGATVKSVRTLGEVSATGLPDSNGLLFVKVPKGSPAARLGLRDLDVIREVAGKGISTFEDFVFAWARAVPADGKIAAQLWRSQAAQPLSLPPFPGRRFAAADARIVARNPDPVYDAAKNYIGRWTDAAAILEWPGVVVDERGPYLLLIEQAFPSSAPTTYSIEGLGSTPLAVSTTQTVDWEEFEKVVVGKVAVDRRGPTTVKIRPIEARSGAVMNFRGMIVLPTTAPVETE
ncbi:MAG: PDZ domain-containing protein [Verrucomicrobiaceae bacterium]|nr:MAG: PDZ domain-containing protein [Verrucomicrobiaceae bacterium]